MTLSVEELGIKKLNLYSCVYICLCVSLKLSNRCAPKFVFCRKFCNGHQRRKISQIVTKYTSYPVYEINKCYGEWDRATLWNPNIGIFTLTPTKPRQPNKWHKLTSIYSMSWISGTSSIGSHCSAVTDTPVKSLS